MNKQDHAGRDLRAGEGDLSDFFENAPVGIHWVGPDGAILRANRAELEMLGYAPEKYIGRHIAEFHADPHVISDILARLSRGETLQNYEARLRCGDGSIKHVLISSNVLWHNGGFVHTRCFTRDITEQKQAEKALRESEQRYRRIVEAAHEGIWQLDAAGRTVFANPRMADMLGCTLEELRAGSVMDFLDADGREQVLALRRRRQQGVAEHAELRFRRKDGTELWTLLSASPLFNADGEYMGVLGLLSDMTHRKRAERALQDADRRKDEFLATLAHELRNPLAPIRNALHLMRSCTVDEPTARLREIMERQVNHLIRLVDDLLEVSRITRGTFELRMERVSLAGAVRNAIETSDPLIRDRRHTLNVIITGEPLWVDGDAVRLAQIVGNLLNNAARYTPAGGEISVDVRREHDRGVIAIRDNGAGISPEMLPRLFQMFSRGSDGGSFMDSGLGIGLALARRLTEMHGGTIAARSAGVGHGSEFAVQIPLAAAPEIEPQVTLRITPTTAPRHRVLVVDDNRDAAETLGLILRSLGADVRVVASGREALRAVSAYSPTLVLLDIGMPDMDGFEVARRIRSEHAALDVKLVALTGWGQEEDRRRARDAGFDHHLVKPAELDALRALISSVDEDAATPSAASIQEKAPRLA